MRQIGPSDQFRVHLKLHRPEVAQVAVGVVLRLVLVVGVAGDHPVLQTLASGQLGALHSPLPVYPKHNTQTCKNTHTQSHTFITLSYIKTLRIDFFEKGYSRLLLDLFHRWWRRKGSWWWRRWWRNTTRRTRRSRRRTSCTRRSGWHCRFYQMCWL